MAACVPGFDAAGPLALADATIYVPTRRSARALAAACASRLGGGSTFLPRIMPLGDLEAMETDALLDSTRFEAAATQQPAVDPLRRRCILTRLVLHWARSVGSATVPPGESTPDEPALVGSTPVDAWHLAGELAELLDELILADVDPRALAGLGTESYDKYWGMTLAFLRIATERWPAILAERGLVDPAVRQKALVEAEIVRLTAGPARDAPLIVAGVVADDPLTMRLIGAIARRPRGAVVLPGLDRMLDRESWALLGMPGEGHGHPQAAMARFLSAAGVSREDVTEIGSVPAELAARARFASQALRPAETTDAWFNRNLTEADRATALRRVSIVEAANEGEEALALAIALREALESDASAVLVTPDRVLARRVREELMRWGVEIDNSGGTALAATPAGALAQLALDCAARNLEPADVLALLAHPAVRLGRPRQMVERLARRAELTMLRGVVRPSVLAEPHRLVAEARARAKAKDASAALRRLGDGDFTAIEALLTDLVAVLEPLRGVGPAEFGTWISVHETVIAALSATDAGTSALEGPDGTRLASLFGGLTAQVEPGLTLDRSAYAALFRRIGVETTVRGPARSHPRLKILGLLEFRLLDADRVLLAGLDETVWPPQVKTDAFLNRPMRAALGLAPPERRIGQMAHDFEMAFCQPEVIISRAAKRGGAPTVPSRFLQRLAAVAGKDAWDACRARGRKYLDYAGALDRPDKPILIGRPEPKPPVALRPTQLSVTRIETLRRDPYAIYAERILGLKPLEPIGAAVGPREWGIAFHGVLGRFIERVRHGPPPPEALAELLQDAQATFAPLAEAPHIRAFLAPRLARWVEGFHSWDVARRPGLAGVLAEAEGRLTIPLADGSTFELTATADRIEWNGAGAIRIVDYKTGAAPSKKEVAAGFAPQLTLEAAIALAGGFAALDAMKTLDEALYVRFGSGKVPALTPLSWDDRDLADVVTEHLAGLKDMLNAFRDPDVGYRARPYPQFIARFGDYDHLSRVKEWSATGGLGDTAGDAPE